MYQALLWHDFVGDEIFNVTLSGCDSLCASALRVHAHASLDGTSNTVMVVNMATTTSFEVVLDGLTKSDSQRAASILQLTGTPGQKGVVLNGKKLELLPNGTPPRLIPTVLGSDTVNLPPASITLLLV